MPFPPNVPRTAAAAAADVSSLTFTSAVTEHQLHAKNCARGYDPEIKLSPQHRYNFPFHTKETEVQRN